MVKKKEITTKTITFRKFKRLFIEKLRHIDKLKLLDFIMNENRWVKIEIN